MTKRDKENVRVLNELLETAESLSNRAKMSQAVFASFLNVSLSTVQKWESQTAGKRPSGAAAKLLQLVEAKGAEVLLT